MCHQSCMILMKYFDMVAYGVRGLPNYFSCLFESQTFCANGRPVGLRGCPM